MILSFFVYGFTALTLYQLANSVVIADKRSLRLYGCHSNLWSLPFVMSILVFAVVSGARYNTGVDHLNYLMGYQTIILKSGIEGGEVGFYSISLFLSSLGVHYFFFFALWAAMQIAFVYSTFTKHRELLPYVALAIILGPYFLEWMNGIRQSIVVCFFLMLVSFQQNAKRSIRNYILCILLILLATTFHRSAFLLIPLFILSQFNYPINNKWINLVLVIACVLLGMTPYWISMTEGATDVLTLIGYDSYAAHYDQYLDLEEFSETAFGPLRISSLAVDLIIIWFYPQINESYSKDPSLNAFFLLFLGGACAYNLFANTNLLFLRPITYLTIFKLPMLAYLLSYLKRKNTSWFYIASVLSFSYTLIEVLKSGLRGVKEYNLYHFFFMV